MTQSDYYELYEDLAPCSVRKTRWEIGSTKQHPEAEGSNRDYSTSPENLGSHLSMLFEEYKLNRFIPNDHLKGALDLGTQAVNMYFSGFYPTGNSAKTPQLSYDLELDSKNFNLRVPIKRKAEFSHKVKRVKLWDDSTKVIKVSDVYTGGQLNRKTLKNRISTKAFEYKMDFLDLNPQSLEEIHHKAIASSKSGRARFKKVISAIIDKPPPECLFIKSLEYRNPSSRFDLDSSIILSGLVPRKYLSVYNNSLKPNAISQKPRDAVKNPTASECANLLFLWPTSDERSLEYSNEQRAPHSRNPPRTSTPPKHEEESLSFDLNISAEKKSFESNINGNIEKSLKSMLSKCLNYIPASIENVDSVLQTLINSGFPGTKKKSDDADEQSQYDWASYAQISLLQNTLMFDFKKRTSTVNDPPLWYGFTDAMLSVKNILSSKHNRRLSRCNSGFKHSLRNRTFSAVVDWFGISAGLLKKTEPHVSEKLPSFETKSSLQNYILTTLNSMVLNQIRSENPTDLDVKFLKEPIDISILLKNGKTLFKEFVQDECNRFKQSISFLLYNNSICKFSIPKEIYIHYNINYPSFSQSQKSYGHTNSLHSPASNMWKKTTSHTSDLFSKFIKFPNKDYYYDSTKLSAREKSLGSEANCLLKGSQGVKPHFLNFKNTANVKSFSKPMWPPVPIPIETLAKAASDVKFNDAETRWLSLISGLKEFSGDGEVTLDCLVGDIYFRNYDINNTSIPRLRKSNLLDALDCGYQIRNFIVREQTCIDNCLDAATNDIVRNLYRRFQSHVIMSPHMSSMINMKGVIYVYELLERFRIHVTSQPKSPTSEAYKKFLISNTPITDVLEMLDIRGTDQSSANALSPAVKDMIFNCLFADKTLSTLWKFPGLIDYSIVYDAHKALCGPGVKAAMKDLETHDHAFTMPPQLKPYADENMLDGYDPVPKDRTEPPFSIKYGSHFPNYSKYSFGARASSVGVGSSEGYLNRLTQDCLQYYKRDFQTKTSSYIPNIKEHPPIEEPEPTPELSQTKYSEGNIVNFKPQQKNEDTFKFQNDKLDENQYLPLGSFFSYREDFGIHFSNDDTQEIDTKADDVVSNPGYKPSETAISSDAEKISMHSAAIDSNSKPGIGQGIAQSERVYNDTNKFSENMYLHEHLKSYPASRPELKSVSLIEGAKVQLLEFMELSLGSGDDNNSILKEIRSAFEALPSALSSELPVLPEPTNIDSSFNSVVEDIDDN